MTHTHGYWEEQDGELVFVETVIKGLCVDCVLNSIVDGGQVHARSDQP